MKKVYAIIGMAGLLLAPSLYATMDVTLYNDTSSYSHNNGGEFRAYGDAGLNAVVDWNAYLSGVTTGGTGNQPYFQTFCTELQEDFYPGHSYLVSTLGYNALNNGGIAAPPVPITMGVAYLYSQFAKGSLVG